MAPPLLALPPQNPSAHLRLANISADERLNHPSKFPRRLPALSKRFQSFPPHDFAPLVPFCKTAFVLSIALNCHPPTLSPSDAIDSQHSTLSRSLPPTDEQRGPDGEDQTEDKLF